MEKMYCKIHEKAIENLQCILEEDAYSNKIKEQRQNWWENKATKRQKSIEKFYIIKTFYITSASPCLSVCRPLNFYQHDSEG